MSNDERVLLVGLDGATFAVLEPLIEDGSMPFLREFVAGGASGILWSTPHPLTPAAWTTVMTGRSPGAHGVYDFVAVDRTGDHPTYTLTTAADCACETLWAIAHRHGRRATVLNFPGTFPAPEIDGFVVPGFVPWNYLPRAVRPRDLYGRLRAQPDFNAQELAIDWSLERKALQGLPEDRLEEWVTFHTKREQQWFTIARHLMREEPCELTAVLFDGVDKLQHVCYHVLDPQVRPSHVPERLRALCREYFRRLDTFLEELVGLAGPDAHVIMVSDHGFRLAGDKIFYVNVWLEQQGLLGWANDVPVDRDRRLTLDGHTETDVLFDWSRTLACALTASSNGIFIRRANGVGEVGVTADEYREFRQRLIRGLRAIVDPATGAPVVADVLVNDDVFAGERTDQAPDLTLVLRDRSFVSVLRTDAVLQPRRSPYGTHDPAGVLMAGGPGVRAGAKLEPLPIVAVAPTVLYAMGIPIPPDIESDPALTALSREWVDAHPVTREAEAVALAAVGAREELDAQAEAQIYERLKALGYIE
jgi:predicted AlkP superfamily phosphohydrolase/phosphomutase